MKTDEHIDYISSTVDECSISLLKGGGTCGKNYSYCR